MRFQALLLDTVGDAVIASDLDGNITYMNAGAEQLFGWPAAVAVGRRVLGTLRPDTDRDRWLAARREAAGGTWRGEVTARRRDGTQFPTYVTLASVRGADGAVTGFIGVSEDISERKRTEQALRDHAARWHRSTSTTRKG